MLLHFKLLVPTRASGQHEKSCDGEDRNNHRHCGRTEHAEPKSKEEDKVIIRSCSDWCGLESLQPFIY